MKRSEFLVALGAPLAAPFIGLSKKGKPKEPIVLRYSTVIEDMSNYGTEFHRHYEDTIDDQVAIKFGKMLKSSGGMKIWETNESLFKSTHRVKNYVIKILPPE